MSVSSIGLPEAARAYGLEDSGAQPLVNEDGSLALAVNGEIYNHRVLRKHLKEPYPFKTNSDCEVIIPLVSAKSLSIRASLIFYSTWSTG